ncbi:MAG TPA: hypothetical protein VNL91_03895 [Thermoanaerobaculia bacterium]|nr:hypothetical protein [Thermoanaerobaculia bacterium]
MSIIDNQPEEVKMVTPLTAAVRAEASLDMLVAANTLQQETIAAQQQEIALQRRTIEKLRDRLQASISRNEILSNLLDASAVRAFRLTESTLEKALRHREHVLVRPDRRDGWASVLRPMPERITLDQAIGDGDFFTLARFVCGVIHGQSIEFSEEFEQGESE